MGMFFFGKKPKTLCSHQLEAVDVKQIDLEITEQLYTEKPNVFVQYKCKNCSHMETKEFHMAGGHIKKFTLEDFK